MNNNTLLEVKNLKKYFSLRGGFLFQSSSGIIKAVDDISFSIKKGETFGLVGESGCGKSTTERVILRLIKHSSGSVIYDGEDLFILLFLLPILCISSGSLIISSIVIRGDNDA